MNAESTVFRTLQKQNMQFGHAALLPEKVAHMDAVAEDIIERGGTFDVEEFVFAMYGLLECSLTGIRVNQDYHSLEKLYRDFAVGKIFIPSSVSTMGRPVESPVYYLPNRHDHNTDPRDLRDQSSLGYRVTRSTQQELPTYVGIIVAPRVLKIDEPIRAITHRSEVTEAEYELQRFPRFAGRDGQAPTERFGIYPIASPHWEFDIVKSLARHQKGVVDTGDVVAIANGLGNARLAFWQFELKQHQNQATVPV